MTELLGIPISLLTLGFLGAYAVAFLAGGVYYLEQRAPRIRDQFPQQGLLARLTGYAALAIGVLTSLAVSGHVLHRHPEFRVASLVAVGAGACFWVYRIHFDPTPVERVRDAALASVCVLVCLLVRWWMTAT